jgi:hypothetical protein
MSKHKSRPAEREISFDAVCLLLETALTGETRQKILADISKSRGLREALARLRDGMRSHIFKAGGDQLDLRKTVKTFDNRTRQDGFHVLQDWDGKAERLNEEIIPVDVLHYFMSQSEPRSIGDSERQVLAILLDYYLVYVLAVLALRAWDEGSANSNFDKLNHLVQELQGPHGSGQKFAENAETLIFIATSHFEPDIKAYERLLAKVRTLDDSHRLNIALVHAAILGSHLRHGFQDLYNKDLALMREDNGPDYPWLCFSLATLMRVYARMHDEGVHGPERERVVEALLNGLSPDARAFVGRLPAALAACEAEHSEFVKLFNRYRQDLFEAFERHRPSNETYSPISFNFNFPHNLLKAVVVDALVRAAPWDLTLNDLLTGIPRGERISKLRVTLAETLMGYARSSPDRIRGRLVPVITYDPASGLRNFAKTLHIIKEAAR